MTADDAVYPCAEGRDPDLLTEYALGEVDPSRGSGIEAHLRTCRACAGRFAAILAAFGSPMERGDVLDHRDEGGSASLPTGSGPGGLPRALPRRRLAAAACLLAAAAAGAVAALEFLHPPSFVTSSPSTPRTVGDAAAIGLRFEDTGIPPESVIVGSSRFLASDAGVGTFVVLRSSPHRMLDLCGFGSDGESLWIASRDWPAEVFESTLRADSLAFLPDGVFCTVTRRAGLRMEETMAVLLRGARRSGVLFVDPRSGALTGRAFHDGEWFISADLSLLQAAPLPARDGDLRRLLMAGQHDLPGGRQACLTVLEPSGACTQHLLLPMLPAEFGLRDPLRHAVEYLRVDWESAGRGLLQAITTDGVIARLPVIDGHIETTAGTIELADRMKETVNLRAGDPGATGRILRSQLAPDDASPDSERSLCVRLLKEVRDTGPDLPSGWVVR